MTPAEEDPPGVPAPGSPEHRKALRELANV